MSKPIPVMLDQPLLERIDKLSEKMGEAKSTVMRIAMRLGLTGLERTLEEAPERLTQDALRSAAFPEHQPSALILNEGGKRKPSSSKGISHKLKDVADTLADEVPEPRPKGQK